MEPKIKRVFKLQNGMIYLIQYTDGHGFIPDSISKDSVIENLLKYINGQES